MSDTEHRKLLAEPLRDSIVKIVHVPPKVSNKPFHPLDKSRDSNHHSNGAQYSPRSPFDSTSTRPVRQKANFCKITSSQNKSRPLFVGILKWRIRSHNETIITKRAQYLSTKALTTSLLLFISYFAYWQQQQHRSPFVECADIYLGAYLGKLNSYAHQVNGDVYLIDEYTFLIKSFFYDGLSQDAFFWAGSSIRPSNKGFIIPSEDGRTNRLQRYTNRDITIRMPDDRKITSIRWLSVWDIRSSKNLGDIIIPDGFEPPTSKRISELSQLAHGVRSDTVTLIDSKSIGVEHLFYDGLGPETYFYVGIGPQPTNLGSSRIPDETGALEPLGAYSGENIVLELPGNLTIFDIDWLSIYDIREQENYGSVLIPSHLNVPPALSQLINYESRLPQCEQLHRDIQLNWEIFGPQITFELVARIPASDYIAFGLSGSENSSQMIGADVALSYLEGHLGYTHDYNLTDKHPCVNLKQAPSVGALKSDYGPDYRGVCPDTKVGGVENYQIHTYARENGLTKLTFRRNLINTGDEGDLVFKTAPGAQSYIVWAVGKLNKFKEPRYHYMYSKGDFRIEFGRKISKNCHQFVMPSHELDLLRNSNDVAFSRQQVAALAATTSAGSRSKGTGGGSAGVLVSHFSRSSSSNVGTIARAPLSVGKHQLSESHADRGYQHNSEQQDSLLSPFFNSISWGQPEILNKTATTFYARLGHPGVNKGYSQITGEGSAGLVWYINGLMAPILHVQRGRTYTFRIEAGDNYDTGYRFYHPFYITDDTQGGYLLQNVTQRNQQKVFAGLQFERAPASGSLASSHSSSASSSSSSSSSSGSAAKAAAAKASNSGSNGQSQGKQSTTNSNKPHVAQAPQLIGKPAPNSSGRLCAWLPNNNNEIRRADTHHSFAQFRAVLNYSCLEGQPGIVQWTPNVSTPDVVYYQSYTQRNMGWKIIVRDDNEEEYLAN